MTTSEKPKGRKQRLRLARAMAEGRELHVPVRKVITKSTARILRELVSTKMGCKVPCESSIELDHYTVLEVRKDVAAFHAQPERLHFTDAAGVIRRHVPDVRVIYVDGTEEIHEVKPLRKKGDKALIELHKAIGAEYARRGECFKVVFEDEVRAQPRLANAKMLRRHRMRRVASSTYAQVLAILSEGPATMNAVQDRLGQGVQSRADLLALALRGVIGMDWECHPIGSGSTLRLNGDRA